MSATLFDKIWDSHIVRDLGNGWALLHIDRHLVHDLSGPVAYDDLARRGLRVRNPELAFATPDHAVSSAAGRTGISVEKGAPLWRSLRDSSYAAGVPFFDLGKPGQGIVHVMGPELGFILPGTTVVCGDSHTCTNGGLGALALGIGSSEVAHVLATQTLRQRKPKRMRISFNGSLGRGVTAKDLILAVIEKVGTAGGSGYAVEYAGSALKSIDIEGRLTICNLSIELGAKIGMIAPDDTTFEWIEGRPYAPKGEQFDLAVKHWRSLYTEPDAEFEREINIDANAVAPMITWGTSPEQAIPVNGVIPWPKSSEEDAALKYMGLTPGAPIAGTKIDVVFIGSCANARLTDLRDAAAMIKGRHIAQGVRAWVVPGSENVKRDAEAEGLDRIFKQAGFEWREPSCSMCAAVNGDRVAPRQRSVSTTNRNFVGRQGPEARTHLVSPAAAAAAAICGVITDPRTL